MKASSLCFRAAVLFVLAGMAWGLQMAISQDHEAMPAHAHLNLLGWVSLFLIGVYYHLRPTLDRSRAAVTQVAIWCLGTIVMTIGIGLVHTGRPAGEPFAAVGSMIVFADMLFFAVLLFRTESGASRERVTVAPAE